MKNNIYLFIILFIVFSYIIIKSLYYIVYIRNYIEKFTDENEINNKNFSDIVSDNSKDLYEENDDYMYDYNLLDDKLLKDPSTSLNEISADMRQINDSKDKTIEDPVDDAYLPNEKLLEIYDINNENSPDIEYNIIQIYKNILDRLPNKDELDKYNNIINNNNMTIDELKIKLLNTPEYERKVKLQSNTIEPELENSYAIESLLNKLAKIYYNILDKSPPKKLLLPLRDCYIHLQYNDYLFKAMLMNDNFDKFETDILDTKTLSKKKLLELFNKYFLLNDIKYNANDLIKTDKLLKRNNKIIPKPSKSDTALPDNNIKETLDNQIDTMNNMKIIIKKSDDIFNLNTDDNNIDNYDDNKYINNIISSPITSNIIESFTVNKFDDENIINDYNDYNNYELNIVLPDNKKYENIKNIINENKYINNVLNSDKIDNDKITKYNSYIKDMNNLKTINNIKNNISNNSNNDKFMRIENPIQYNKIYLGDPMYRPPVCTTLGQKNIVQPVFLDSKTLFNGTSLSDAFEYTQVGSMLPKFDYKEYIDIKL